ncbi:MAG TPA: hypothetical protein VFA47_12710 [Candidatus Manganitrophaceae bacterium]|nr:hypothetical protein [Candidatus Manganitrophaceae bacterium]
MPPIFFPIQASDVKSAFRMILFGVLFLFLSGPSISQSAPKELPMLVTLKDLSSEPDQYDGHRVVVTGRVRSIEVQTGRRGSQYALLVLEEEAQKQSDPRSTVFVITMAAPTVRQGNQALIQGVYHLEGRQAGRSFNHFIDAEVIMKEKS